AALYICKKDPRAACSFGCFGGPGVLCASGFCGRGSGACAVLCAPPRALQAGRERLFGAKQRNIKSAYFTPRRGLLYYIVGSPPSGRKGAAKGGASNGAGTKRKSAVIILG